jgi:hypothetical protein
MVAVDVLSNKYHVFTIGTLAALVGENTSRALGFEIRRKRIYDSVLST